ncbi:MAG: NAD(P)-dependent alcohol dehydrogenase [Terracidiphilus sp.]
MPSCKGFAALDARSALAPYNFSRREPGPTEIAVEILFCGVCHTDLHMSRNEWGQSMPCVRGEEHFCDEGPTLTYASPDRVDGSITMGGYANNYTVDERFAHTVPANLDLAAVAPLLCAGITTYSPLRHWKAGPGKKVGIVGLGGLGHMALKFAHSFGAHVVQFTTSLKKKNDALRLGANEVVLSTDADAMKGHTKSFDFILDTVSGPHALEDYLALLKQDATMTLVGLPETPPSVSVFSLITKRAAIAGSMIGGMPETQEMLNYCGAHNIVSEVEVIPIQKVNEAFERLLKQDVKYRFVIDMSSLG